MAKRSARILQKMGHEMKERPPAVLAKTMRKQGKAAMERQRKAILLSKARAAGAKV